MKASVGDILKVTAVIALLNLTSMAFVAAGAFCVDRGCMKTAVMCFISGILTAVRPNLKLG